jgi:hypothetical protein
LKQSTVYFTPGMDQVIEEKENLRDLGVMMSILPPSKTTSTWFVLKLIRKVAGSSELSSPERSSS